MLLRLVQLSLARLSFCLPAFSSLQVALLESSVVCFLATDLVLDGPRRCWARRGRLLGGAIMSDVISFWLSWIIHFWDYILFQYFLVCFLFGIYLAFDSQVNSYSLI